MGVHSTWGWKTGDTTQNVVFFLNKAAIILSPIIGIIRLIAAAVLYNKENKRHKFEQINNDISDPLSLHLKEKRFVWQMVGRGILEILCLGIILGTIGDLIAGCGLLEQQSSLHKENKKTGKKGRSDSNFEDNTPKKLPSSEEIQDSFFTKEQIDQYKKNLNLNEKNEKHEEIVQQKIVTEEIKSEPKNTEQISSPEEQRFNNSRIIDMNNTKISEFFHIIDMLIHSETHFKYDWYDDWWKGPIKSQKQQEMIETQDRKVTSVTDRSKEIAKSWQSSLAITDNKELIKKKEELIKKQEELIEYQSTIIEKQKKSIEILKEALRSVPGMKYELSTINTKVNLIGWSSFCSCRGYEIGCTLEEIGSTMYKKQGNGLMEWLLEIRAGECYKKWTAVGYSEMTVNDSQISANIWMRKLQTVNIL